MISTAPSSASKRKGGRTPSQGLHLSWLLSWKLEKNRLGECRAFLRKEQLPLQLPPGQGLGIGLKQEKVEDKRGQGKW